MRGVRSHLNVSRSCSVESAKGDRICKGHFPSGQAAWIGLGWWCSERVGPVLLEPIINQSPFFIDLVLCMSMDKENDYYLNCVISGSRIHGWVGLGTLVLHWVVEPALNSGVQVQSSISPWLYFCVFLSLKSNRVYRLLRILVLIDRQDTWGIFIWQTN